MKIGETPSHNFSKNDCCGDVHLSTVHKMITGMPSLDDESWPIDLWQTFHCCGTTEHALRLWALEF